MPAEPGFVLDSGALIALESRSKQRRLLSMLDPLEEGGRLVISAGSVAEAWRGSARQAPLARLIRGPATDVVAITAPVAKAIGAFLGHSANGDDIVDAHVVMLARSRKLAVITSDPRDLLTLDPKLPHLRV